MIQLLVSSLHSDDHSDECREKIGRTVQQLTSSGRAIQECSAQSLRGGHRESMQG